MVIPMPRIPKTESTSPEIDQLIQATAAYPELGKWFRSTGMTPRAFLQRYGDEFRATLKAFEQKGKQK